MTLPDRQIDELVVRRHQMNEMIRPRQSHGDDRIERPLVDADNSG